MAKISTYPLISVPTYNDLLIGTDVENLNETKNFSLGDIASLILTGNYVPYVGATDDVFLGAFNISANSFINTNGTSSDFLKADGSLDSTAYQVVGNYITALSGEATATGPGNANVVLSNNAVTAKLLTGLSITGSTITSSDSILTAFGKVQNQINGIVSGLTYKGAWNANTNIPHLTSSVGTQGWYYVVSVAGSTSLDGITDWNVGDWAIFNGSQWQQIDNTDAVVSVNGQIGVVVLTTTNITEGTRLYYTDSRARSAISLTTTGSSGAATYSSLTGVLNVPNYTASGLGVVPTSRELTINGTTYDLSANRTWSVGTVTSISTSAPLTGGTITGAGTIGITQSSGSTNGYLSSTDWTTFNNKQNALTNPVTGTGTTYYIPMWSGTSALTDSILSYSSNTVTFNYNTNAGGTVNYTNTNGTPYTYTIQMNNATAPRQTYHSYTDGNIIQQINSNIVSKNLQSGQLVLPYYTSLSSFTGTAVGVLAFDASGNIITSAPPTAGLTSVGLSMPSAFTVSNSPLTADGTIAVTGAGTTGQYVRGDGTLAVFPSVGGGGGGTVYYLNGNTSQGSIGGTTMYQLSVDAQSGATANFSRNTTGNIASFITDSGEPNQLAIPAGIWVFECYMSETGGGGSHATVQAVVEKWNGSTLTTIATGAIEEISNGSTKDLYQIGVSIPTGVTLLATDRIVVQINLVASGGKTVTLYTENSNISSVVTTFANGISALNGLTSSSQYFAVGTSGTDFAISSVTDTHTFNLPTASATNRGALSSADWTAFNSKVSSNIYTADGTLASSRTITLGGYYLAFAGSSFTTTINSTGLVGIGITPSTYKLSVGGGMQLVNSTISKILISPNSSDNSIDSLNQAGTAYFPLTALASTVEFRTGTAIASTSMFIDTTGQLRFSKYLTTSSFSGTAAGYLAFDSSGNVITVPSPTGTNIYNSNGTLTGNRTVTFGGYSLAFVSSTATNFLLSSTGVSYFYSDGDSSGTRGTLNVLSNANVYADPYDASLYIGGKRTDLNNNNETTGFRFLVSNAGAANSILNIQRAYQVVNGSNQFPDTYETLVQVGGRGGLLVGGTSLSSTAILQADSTTKGFLLPRMTSTQRTAITTPATGLVVYQTDATEGLYQYLSTGWAVISGGMAIGGSITSATAGSILFAGTSGVLAQDNANFFWDDTNNRLGIGTATPTYDLTIRSGGEIRGLGNLVVGSSSSSINFTANRIFLRTSDSSNAIGIFSNNNVLIQNGGTFTDAGYRLDVNGTARVSGNTIVGSLDATSSAFSEIGANTRFLAINTNNLYFIGSPTGYFINSSNIVLGGSGGLTIRTHVNANIYIAPSGGICSIGSNSPDTSAVLQATSTTKGFLPPRMTTTQKNAIATPAAGLVVFDTTSSRLNYYDGTWENVATTADVAATQSVSINIVNYYNFI